MASYGCGRQLTDTGWSSASIDSVGALRSKLYTFVCDCIHQLPTLRKSVKIRSSVFWPRVYDCGSYLGQNPAEMVLTCENGSQREGAFPLCFWGEFIGMAAQASLPSLTRDCATRSRASVSTRGVQSQSLGRCLNFRMWLFLFSYREAGCLSQLIQNFAFLSFGFLYHLNIVALIYL